MNAPVSPLQVNMHRLFLLRWIAIAGQLAAIGITDRFLGMHLPLQPLLLVVALLAVFNIVTGLWLRSGKSSTDAQLVLQLLVDVLALGALLYFTGGSTNPFVSLYLLPIAIASALVRPAYVWFLVGVTSLCYSFLLVWYVPLPHFHGAHGHDNSFSLHVLGMWFTFMLAAALIAWFVVRMATSLRERDRELARVREAQLRDEQIIGLGTLAAGTAHELGTPLSTIAVLARELELATIADKSLQQDVQAIRAEVDRCKTILGQLSEAAGHLRAEGGQAQGLDTLASALANHWQLLRPSVPLLTTVQGEGDIPQVVVDRTLQQAILNLLNNAADASPAGIELIVHWDVQVISWQILDHGPGLPPDVVARTGTVGYSTKGRDGIGIGIFLANATIERLGGTVQFANRDGGGAAVTVTVPRRMIEVPA